MTRKQKRLLFRIIVAAVLFAAGSLLPLGPTVEMGVFLVCYAVIGWDIVWKAVTNILHGQVFDENFLMTIATIGALDLGGTLRGCGRYAVLSGGRMVPVLCGFQIQKIYCQFDGHSPGLCECRTERKIRTG